MTSGRTWVPTSDGDIVDVSTMATGPITIIDELRRELVLAESKVLHWTRRRDQLIDVLITLGVISE